MSSFRFNVNKTNNQLYEIRKKIDKYKSVVERTYSNLNNIKNNWSDPASETFYRIVKNDENGINDIIDSLYKFQENMEYFSNELGNLLSNYGYSTSHMDISYNSDNINYVINELNNIEVYMNRSIDAFATCLVPSDYEYKWLIDEVYNEAYRFRDIARGIRDDLYNLRTNIESIINNSKSKDSNINVNILSDPMSRVSSSVVSVVANTNFDFKNSTNSTIKNTSYRTTDKRNK